MKTSACRFGIYFSLDSSGGLFVVASVVIALFTGCSGDNPTAVGSDSGHDTRIQDALVRPDTRVDCAVDTSLCDGVFVDDRSTDPGTLDDAPFSADIVAADMVEENCTPVAGGPLVSNPEGLYFGGVLVGFSETMSARLTNSGTDAMTITSIKLDSSKLSLVDPPATPFLLQPCATFSLKVSTSDDPSAEAWYYKDIVVTYNVNGGDSQTILIEVQAAWIDPSTVWCEIFLLKPPENDLSIAAQNDEVVAVGNKGTGRCVASTVAIADCTVDGDDVVRCPSPEQATPSSYFRLQLGPSNNGTAYIGSGDPWAARVYLTDSRPPILPHHGMLYMIAKDEATGKQANYPLSTTLGDGTVNHDFTIRIVE